MDGILAVFLGLILGIILMYWLYSLFRKKKAKELTEQQSVILLDKIKKVCKLIAVEGDFAEIYTYENTRERFLSLVSSKKKALIVIRAKVHIGYDLKLVQVHANTDKKQVILSGFPQPEILSVEPDLEFYDIKNGLFNSFSPDDLTTVNQEAKKHIREKVPASGLIETAQREALEAILLAQSLVETIGWTLDYSALEIQANSKKQIENKNRE